MRQGRGERLRNAGFQRRQFLITRRDAKRQHHQSPRRRGRGLRRFGVRERNERFAERLPERLAQGVRHLLDGRIAIFGPTPQRAHHNRIEMLKFGIQVDRLVHQPHSAFAEVTFDVIPRADVDGRRPLAVRRQRCDRPAIRSSFVTIVTMLIRTHAQLRSNARAKIQIAHETRQSFRCTVIGRSLAVSIANTRLRAGLRTDRGEHLCRARSDAAGTRRL